MPTLDPKRDYVVLINTFTVDPERADELLENLSRATRDGMRQRPGFVSANLHISRDRQHVANYVQWESQEAIDAMMGDPQAQEHMRNAAALATAFDPVYYSLLESHVAEQ